MEGATIVVGCGLSAIPKEVWPSWSNLAGTAVVVLAGMRTGGYKSSATWPAITATAQAPTVARVILPPSSDMFRESFGYCAVDVSSMLSLLEFNKLQAMIGGMTPYKLVIP